MKIHHCVQNDISDAWQVSVQLQSNYISW